MRIGKLEFYTYPSGNMKVSFTNYTGHEFYCENRKFRYHLTILGIVFNLQWFNE